MMKNICMTKWLVLVLVICGWAIGLMAQAQEVNEVPAISAADALDKYKNCVSLAQNAPQSGFEVGQKWRDEGGGLPAQHCVAIALVGLGLYQQAAEQLEVIASDFKIGKGLNFSYMAGHGDGQLLADIYLQAGNVWMLANRPIMAYDILSQALLEVTEQTPQAQEIYIDRARASGQNGDYDLALEDLNKARKQGVPQADIFSLLAAANRSLNKYTDAKSIINQGLDKFPNDPNLLLERGNLSYALGKNDAARLDWVQIIAQSPDSTAADVAKQNIEKLQKPSPKD